MTEERLVRVGDLTLDEFLNYARFLALGEKVSRDTFLDAVKAFDALVKEMKEAEMNE